MAYIKIHDSRKKPGRFRTLISRIRRLLLQFQQPNVRLTADVAEIEAAVIARDRVRADLIRLFERVNLLRFSTLTIKQIKIATISKKQELLQKGFNINLEDGFSAKLEISCKHKGLFPEFPVYYAQANLPVVVRCMPTSYETTKGPPPRPGRHLDIDPPITAVSVVADPPETQGRQGSTARCDSVN